MSQREKACWLGKRESLHSPFTFVFSKHLYPILSFLNDFCNSPILQVRKLWLKFAVLNFTSLKHHIFQCNSNLGNFPQKELQHERFLWNNKHKDNRRKFLCCPEKNKAKMIKMARPQTKIWNTRILVPAAINILPNVCDKSKPSYEGPFSLTQTHIHTELDNQSLPKSILYSNVLSNCKDYCLKYTYFPLKQNRFSQECLM